MDPIGLGFESFDGIGQFRTVENGQPIDASGLLSATDIDGSFSGVVDLAHRLSQSAEVRSCMVTQWFRYAYGRGETADDKSSLSELGQHFAQSGFKLRELVLALVQTDAFLYRTVPTPGGP
jgi:hypothetical protein